jgi:uncharacterized CHY-type Zn-finger protein
MCRHVLNAQVAIRAPCCKRWFDCAQCHAESPNSGDHMLTKSDEMTFACKKCKAVFRKQMETFEEADEFCPRCDNHFVLELEEAVDEGIQIGVEGNDARVYRDDREKARHVEENEELKGKMMEQALLDMMNELEETADKAMSKTGSKNRR